MLHFYRVIRARLIHEGKIQRYLLYAIGEIILLVIGILLALQINTWNQQRINRKLERAYLERFQADLTEDIEDINKQLKFGKASMGYLKQAMELMHQENTEKDMYQLNEYYDLAYMVPLSPQTSTYRELESTGRFNLIRDEALRLAILKHYAAYEQMELSLERMATWYKMVSRDMDADTSVLKYTALTKDLFLPEHRYTDDWSYLNVIEDPRFQKTEAGFAASGFWIAYALWIYEEMLPQIESLKKQIVEELAD